LAGGRSGRSAGAGAVVSGARHTPGPWHVNAIDSKRNRITGDETSTGWDRLHVNGGNATIARVYKPVDARLIASAPELLAACKSVLDSVPFASYRGDGELEECEERLRAAILKAEGGDQ
jgi:hypothetical protein